MTDRDRRPEPASPRPGNRRPIAARSAGWAQHAAAWLARTRVTPNQISVFSIVFAVVGALLLLRWPTLVGLVGCALAIQGRLVCNLLDGMVAVEGGRKSPLGALYNEFPDRIADSLFIVALGYASGMPAWGWSGALAAALTAYVRLAGGALGLAQSFRGPMAKQHRMAVMTGACLIGAGEQVWAGSLWSLKVACVTIALGSALTCVTRTRDIARQLQDAERAC
ncbi:CDP-alcohol phosphatidyltransferase family protein [Methyloversatilis thermotolerans]|uniref:CDP-alcohol phosphatidyltransferase family protein n=1 Tax=Methyloversatilis thermotolerans TaxID=1346290 RepID=UPI0003740E21|nr:CDP-alcohol phosphatidyltransferase family protein [Methyloversatilis thermotolerans]